MWKCLGPCTHGGNDADCTRLAFTWFRRCNHRCHRAFEWAKEMIEALVIVVFMVVVLAAIQGADWLTQDEKKEDKDAD